jgi:ribose/xylose/arabinose/galactoside ABC-type transport system permease subunit
MTLTPTQDAPSGAPAAATRRPRTNWTSYATLMGMVLVVLGIGLARPRYLSTGNMRAVLIEATVLIVLAVGLTLVMSMKGIDLSVAATADLAGYVAAVVLIHGGGASAAIGVALGIGITVGLLNGALTGYLGVPAIVATLGLNLLLTAVALVVSDNGMPQQLFTAPADLVGTFLSLGSGSLGPVRYLVLVTAVVVLVAWFATRKTVWGRQVDLVDSSARAAFLSGIPVRRTFATGFVAAGLLAAVAGVMLTARTGVVVPGSAEPLLLSAFTAVYLGSVASPKGRITVLWTVVGALFVTLLANGLTLLGLGAPWRTGLNGALILLALVLGTLRRRATRR